MQSRMEIQKTRAMSVRLTLLAASVAVLLGRPGVTFSQASVESDPSMLAMETTGNSLSEHTGSLNGKVLFAGELAKPQRLEISKDVAVCGSKQHFEQSLLVSDGGGLANVVVRLKGIKRRKSHGFEHTEFQLDQKGCQFVPHVLLVPTGAQLTIHNSDGILHNIHTYSDKNKAINKAQPRFLKTLKVSFDHPEIVRLACDVHDWMGCYIAVIDHTFNAVSDETGAFEILDVPSGNYTVDFWHETAGVVTKKVTVVADRETTMEVVYDTKQTSNDHN